MTDLIKKLVIERLKAMPFDVDISIGEDAYSKEELLSHVEKNDKIGQQITKIQLNFLRDLGSGKIYGENFNNQA